MGKTVDLAGVAVDNVSLNEAAEIVRQFVIEGKPRLVVTPNPEMIVAAQEDEELQAIINGADLRVADGISLVVVSRILGHPLKERVSGIDLMLKLLAIGADYNYRVFLLGGAPGIAEAAASRIKQKYPGLNLVGTHDGYFAAGDESAVIKKIRAARPDLLFAGLGAGRQERWLNQHLAELGATVGLAVGGSFDVLSGRKRRAPRWVRALCLEWLYRLVTEPQRWQRQLALPKFLYLTLVKPLIAA
ncbi:MAG: WecB/TagA/CpsF family glycosyltransferase [Candidatus Saganbacteria bacterium]|nr:WecB/TagA/CpsF family glycosyltransferase [Candidatus Saganbacteria bacterium]